MVGVTNSMSYKTLILIDNSSSLTSLNQEIVKETVKYFIKNAGEENKTAIAVTGETAEYLTNFDDSLDTQLKTIENLQFTDVNAPGVDVLMEVILDWKKGDLADRDIVFISARNIGVVGDYSEEELLFEVNSKLYPIYTLACAQDENDGVIKGLGILSRISGGECISTKDATSDAEIEKQLCEMLYKSMNTYRMAELEKFENTEKDAANVNDYDNGNGYKQGKTYKDAGDEYLDADISEENAASDDVFDSEIEDEYTLEKMEAAEDDRVIYEYSAQESKPINTNLIVGPVIVIILILMIISVRMLLIKKKEKREDEKFLKSVAESKSETEKNITAPFSDNEYKETTILSTHCEDETDTGTRLLYQTKEGIEITLEDRADPTKYFRACVRDSVVIGRNEKLCDVAINYDDSISSRHCELFSRDSNLYCRDLGSSNGTMVNQQKVYQEIQIESGDILRIGRLTFFIQIVGDMYE